MDWRAKRFESEARAAFAHLVERGLTVGVDPVPDESASRHRHGEVPGTGGGGRYVLVLAFAGEDAVHTTLRTITGSSDFGPTVAHSGHEMKKALSEHAEADPHGALKPMTDRRLVWAERAHSTPR